jgi:hypothetical protein
MDKLTPKALSCMFIGYCDDGMGYLILNLVAGKLVRTIHVASVESQPVHAQTTPTVAPGHSQASPPSGLEHGSHQCQSLMRKHHAV